MMTLISVFFTISIIGYTCSFFVKEGRLLGLLLIISTLAMTAMACLIVHDENGISGFDRFLLCVFSFVAFLLFVKSIYFIINRDSSSNARSVR